MQYRAVGGFNNGGRTPLGKRRKPQPQGLGDEKKHDRKDREGNQCRLHGRGPF